MSVEADQLLAAGCTVQALLNSVQRRLPSSDCWMRNNTESLGVCADSPTVGDQTELLLCALMMTFSASAAF
jgi:hypothetical protein